MNVNLLQPPIRYLLVSSLALLGTVGSATGQNASPYKGLATAINTVVSDTVIGQNRVFMPLARFQSMVI